MTVTLSSKYQVVIPQDVRDEWKLHPGMQFDVMSFGDYIGLIPLRPISELRGTLKGMNLSAIREKKDRKI